MQFRQAELTDIPGMQVVRHFVKENTLSDPSLVPDDDVALYISERGRGWVCEAEGKIIGFSIADLLAHSIWALFVDPIYEGKGVGKILHGLMLDWYFAQTNETVRLGTAAGTRAEKFYEFQGWNQVGVYPNGEIKFEMTAEVWKLRGNTQPDL
ncbi:GNAT family N-acetyltransferase [Pedobacter sp. GR22-6]|uniref:GNAT family N-acetyltransferase n=1 Tax=Pedobacter sp. GR22-6 TaxID=3127957 RepID=UPI00307E4180